MRRKRQEELLRDAKNAGEAASQPVRDEEEAGGAASPTVRNAGEGRRSCLPDSPDSPGHEEECRRSCLPDSPGQEEDAGGAASLTARDTRRMQEELHPRQPGTRGGCRRSCLPDSPGHSEGAGGAASQTAWDARRRQEELPPRQSGTREVQAVTNSRCTNGLRHQEPRASNQRQETATRVADAPIHPSAAAKGRRPAPKTRTTGRHHLAPTGVAERLLANWCSRGAPLRIAASVCALTHIFSSRPSLLVHCDRGSAPIRFIVLSLVSLSCRVSMSCVCRVVISIFLRIGLASVSLSPKVRGLKPPRRRQGNLCPDPGP